MSHYTSRMRMIAMCLLIILFSETTGNLAVSVAFSEESIESSPITSSGEILSKETTEEAIMLDDSILSGSLEPITLSGEDIFVESGSIIDATLSGGNELINTGSTIDMGSGDLIENTGSIIIDESIQSKSEIIKEYIDTIDSNTGAPLPIDSNITPELKETILDEYMDNTEKSRLSADQTTPNIGVSENQITSILREAIENEGDNEIRLFIKTTLDSSKLQELFGFFDTESPFVFNEQYRDIIDDKTVYEMVFSRESNLGKRMVEYLDLGVVPENFFETIEIIRPGFVYSLAGSGYLDGESSTANWGIQKIKADLYQHLFGSRPRIKIGVIDTGVNITHQDLVDNIYTNPGEISGNNIDDDGNGYIDDIHGYSFVYNTGVVTDVHTHGTHVAGIIGAAVNGKGIYGTYSKAWIVPLKALGDTGYGSTYGIANAIRYAADNGIPVINMSLGSAGNPTQTDMLCVAITYARSKGTVSIVSAGNSNINITGFSPSGCQDAIAVGAVDSSLTKASFSNYGTGVRISAPGVSIYSTVPGGYGGKSGTSMAAPFVAGAVGAIFAMAGVMDTDQVRTLLSQNGDTITTTVPMGVSLNLQKIFTALGISVNPGNPVIVLSGSSTINIALGGTFVDPGASCVDDIDPSCTVTVSGSVNTSLSGTYLITYSAIDNSGNLAIPLTRSVRVSDLTPPVITLSGASVMNIVVGSSFVDPGASCVDNYDTSCTVSVSGSVNTGVFGTYILTYKATDASGNKATNITRTVNVTANIGSPIITLSGASVMNIALGGTFVDPGASCVDDIDPSCTVTISGSVNTSLSGTYLITYSAIDNSGNLAIPLTRSVRVSDLTPPVITLSGASVMNIVVGSSFVDPGASCVDNYDTGSITPGNGTKNGCNVMRRGEVNANLTGSYILTYSATDTSGNKAVDVTRTVNVVVSLSTPPVITLSGPSTMNIALGGTFVDPGASCVDDIDPTCTVTVSGSVNTSLSGTYLITYSAKDSGNNQAIPINRTVHVFDFTPPVITLSGSSTMNIAIGGTFVDPGAVCVDDVALSCIVNSTGTVNTSLSGIYLITYTAVDASGNISAPIVRTVRVSDLTPPVITLSGANTMNIALGGTFVDPGASCVDNYDPLCSVIVNGNVNINQTGSYQLLYTATDISGNNATPIGRMITVYQVILPPVITPIPTPTTPTPTPIVSGPGGGGGGGGGSNGGGSSFIHPIPNPSTPTTPVPEIIKGIKKVPQKIKSKVFQKVIEKVDNFGKIKDIAVLSIRSEKKEEAKNIIGNITQDDIFYVGYTGTDGWAFINTLKGYWGFIKSSYIQLLK